jgi:hypothetical protein
MDKLPTGEDVYNTKCYVITEEDKPDDKVKEYKSNLVFAKDNIHVIENKINVKNITYFEYIIFYKASNIGMLSHIIQN